jgi:hypothetical protein
MCLIFAIKAGAGMISGKSPEPDQTAYTPAKTKGNGPKINGTKDRDSRVIQSVTVREHHEIDHKNAPRSDLQRLHENKQPQWRKNAVDVKKDADKPAIAIVIDDVGLNRSKSRAAMQLQGPLTLALLPYADKLEQQAEMARQNGHELLVHLPMQPKSRDTHPGPRALRADLKSGEIQKRVSKALSAFDGYVGINNHMGSRFTEDREGMTLLMRELADRGLLYLDSLTTPDSVGAKAAAHHNVPYAARNVFLDHVAKPARIRKALRKVERIAREDGRVIAIGHPKAATLAALKQWMPKARAKGFQFLPVSALVQRMHKTAHMQKKEPVHKIPALQ